jgi:hypothetical protein
MPHSMLWKKQVTLGLSLWLISMIYIAMMSWLAQESIGQNIPTMGIWRSFEVQKKLHSDWYLIDPRTQSLWEEIKVRYTAKLGNEPPLVDAEEVEVSRGAWRSALLAQRILIEEAQGWGRNKDISLLWIQDQREVLVRQDMVAVSTFNQAQFLKKQKKTKANSIKDEDYNEHTQASSSVALDAESTLSNDATRNKRSSPTAQKFKIKQTQGDILLKKVMQTYYRPILMIASYSDKKVWFDPKIGVVFGMPKGEWKTAPALRLLDFKNTRW